jgi:hypothetical protein
MDNVMLPPDIESVESLPPLEIFPTVANVSPTTATILINNENIAFQAYNIQGRNFFRLRDIAYVLNGTSAQFNVTWNGENNAIVITTNQAYDILGGEMIHANTEATTATRTYSTIFLNGSQLTPTAYNIGGHNFFMLRELGEYLNFNVDWDVETNTVLIMSSNKNGTCD